MISDVLSDAVHDIEEYLSLYDRTIYADTKDDIRKLLLEMTKMRIRLDFPPQLFGDLAEKEIAKLT